jgi:hypothetical protein
MARAARRPCVIHFDVKIVNPLIPLSGHFIKQIKTVALPNDNQYIILEIIFYSKQRF